MDLGSVSLANARYYIGKENIDIYLCDEVMSAWVLFHPDGLRDVLGRWLKLEREEHFISSGPS